MRPRRPGSEPNETPSRRPRKSDRTDEAPEDLVVESRGVPGLPVLMPSSPVSTLRRAVLRRLPRR